VMRLLGQPLRRFIYQHFQVRVYDTRLHNKAEVVHHHSPDVVHDVVNLRK
jgi:hypothetical protein